MAGIIYGWIGVYYGKQLQMVDTWYFHYNGLKQYQLLVDKPTDFFTGLFKTSYESGFSKFLTSTASWWNDIKYLFFEKILAIFNVFSFGNYYTNVIFYSFLTLFGPIALYRIMKEVFPNRERLLQVAVFLIPSFLFWNSGLHKDGLVFLSFAIISYHFYYGFKEQKFSFQRVVFILLAFILLILRSFVLVVLLPALLAWIISHKSRYKPVYVFSIVYLIFITLFFTTHYFIPEINFMQAVATRQQEFLSLHGNSSVVANPLEPTIVGFMKNAPQAIILTIFRPSLWDAHHLFSLAACVETMIFLLFFLIFIFYRRKEINKSSFLLFGGFLSFSMLLMIGYSVNILGAIVRYRSIVLPFLLTPVLAMTDWKRVKEVFKTYANK